MLDLWLCSYNAPVPAPPAYSAQGEGSCECSIMGKRTALGMERCRGRGKVCEHERVEHQRVDEFSAWPLTTPPSAYSPFL